MTERLVEGTEQVVITEDCLKMETEDFIEQYLARHDCLLIPPIRYARGAKQCRILALDADSLTDFYVDLSSPRRQSGDETRNSVGRSGRATADRRCVTS